MASLPWNISLINIPSYPTIHSVPCPTLNSHHYLQVKGTAMGILIAPSNANLFMGYLEQDFLNSELDKPSLWLSFINDIFLLWPHCLGSLTTFLEQLNSHYPVHFTWNTFQSYVIFLDVMFALTKVNSAPPFTLNPPTTDNIFIITDATPYQLKV